MIKLKYDNKFFKNSMLVFFLLLILIIVYKAIDNISSLFSYIINITAFTLNLLKPFIYALIIAYFLNPFVKFLEEHLFKRNEKYLANSRKRRCLSILILYLIILLLFALIINYIIPVIKLNIKDLFKNIPTFLSNTERFINNLPSEFITSKSIKINEKISEIIIKYTENIDNGWINMYFGRIMEQVFKLTMGFMKVLLGFIIAIYIMIDKEKISEGTHRIIRAIFKESTYQKINFFLAKTNIIFSKFIIGKFIDSFIVAVLCLLIMLLFKIKYSLLISIIIGISNMIPYFGPIVGAVPPIIITLLYSPGKAILVAFLLFILQQFDGNYLEPKILGDSMGLSPLWIIFAIFAGGGLFGFFGMLMGVPAAAVIKSIIDGWIDKRLENR
ncbi:MAG: AI-2E family transporter [Clostridiaceae bacterium]